jgi:hypothetical protein
LGFLAENKWKTGHFGKFLHSGQMRPLSLERQRMWIISPEIGFFSIVQKPEDVPTGTLTVRARVASDLDDLRAKYLPELSPTRSTPRADYEFRATAPQPAVARALAAMCNDIDFENVKSRAAEVQGEARELVYHRVWDALRGLASPAVRDRLPIVYGSIGNRPDIDD